MGRREGKGRKETHIPSRAAGTIETSKGHTPSDAAVV